MAYYFGIATCEIVMFTAGLDVQYEPTKIVCQETRRVYNTFETTVGKLLARRIQIFRVYFCLDIILKVVLNNFQNNA